MAKPWQQRRRDRKRERQKGLVGALVWPIFQLNCLQMAVHLSVCLYTTDNHSQTYTNKSASSAHAPLYFLVSKNRHSNTHTLFPSFSLWVSIPQHMAHSEPMRKWRSSTDDQSHSSLWPSWQKDAAMERGGSCYRVSVVSNKLSCQFISDT